MYTEGKNCCRAGNAKQGRFRIHRTEQVFDTFIDPLPGQNAAHMGCFAVKSPDILVEGALEMDVHQLRAAADAQHWNVLLHRRFQQPEFQGVPLGVEPQRPFPAEQPGRLPPWCGPGR